MYNKKEQIQIKRKLTQLNLALDNLIVKENDFEYIDRGLDPYVGKGIPGFQVKDALEEMIQNDVSCESILDLVRTVQLNTISHFLLILTSDYTPDYRKNWVLSIKDRFGKTIILNDPNIVLSKSLFEKFKPREWKNRTKFKPSQNIDLI